MFTTLSRLWSAFARLAVAVEDLAGTAEEANAGVRGQLGLPAQAKRQTAQAPAPAAAQVAYNFTEHPDAAAWSKANDERLAASAEESAAVDAAATGAGAHANGNGHARPGKRSRA